MKELKGKTAVITGAARGMGKSLAARLLNEGCRVAMADLDQQALDASVQELGHLGECRGFICNITDTDSVEALADDVKSAFGDASILVNNAGIVKAAPVEMLDEKDVQLMIDVNLTSLFRTCRIFLPQLKNGGEGHIVNMASAGGILAIPNLSAYSATKFGVIGFSDALRQEMKKEKTNIGVTYVCPNTVNTGMFNGSKMVSGTKMLTADTVTGAVLKAIRRNRPMCGVPHLSTRVGVPLMKFILPINGMDGVCKMLGMWTINDSWQGRTAKAK